MRTDWRDRVPPHHFFDDRRDVGQRHLVAKVGKSARPNNTIDLPLCSALRIRMKNHREEEGEQ
jgi:hypothetical protein